MVRIISCLLIGILPVFINGCGLGVLAAGIGYAVSSSKEADADMAKAEAELQKSYNEYKLGMERVNIERDSKGLKPQPILTFEEWLRITQPEKVRENIAVQRTQQIKEPNPENPSGADRSP